MAEIHTKNVAAGFLSIFSKFAVETCGCEQPDDRVKLRKAVWHQTVGLHLKDFEKKFHNQSHLRTIAAMECPVQIPGKNLVGPRDESSPSKIILASKLLRAHTDVSEATTCRGCSKRGRCPFVRKIVPNNPTKTSLGAVCKVLFGMSQSCRLHLKDPERNPFVISAAEIEAGMKLTSQLSRFLEPSAMERQLRNVPLADRKAVKAIVTRQLKKNEALKQQRMEASKQGLPEELAERKLDEPKTREVKGPKFDVNSDDWIPEEKGDGFGETNIQFRGKIEAKPATEKSQFIQVDKITDLPIPERYPQGRKLIKAKSDKTVKKPTYDVSRVDTKSSPDNHSVSGGYVVGNRPVSSPGIEYIKPQLMRGKRVTDNVKVAEKVWENPSPYISELKFLKRVPFQSDPPSSSLKSDPTLAKVLQQRLKAETHISHKPDPSLHQVVERSGKLEFPKLPSWDAAALNKVKVGEKTEKIRLGVNGAVSERLRTDFSKFMRPKERAKASQESKVSGK